MKRFWWNLPVVVAVVLLSLPKITAQQVQQDDLRKQIGTIIVHPDSEQEAAYRKLQREFVDLRGPIPLRTLRRAPEREEVAFPIPVVMVPIDPDTREPLPA